MRIAGWSIGKAVGLGLIVFVMTCLPSTAIAVDDGDEFARFGSSGGGAGQMQIPHGVATDPTTGNVFVAETENSRVSEFTPWGQFLQAWGWGVRNGANELQLCGPAAPIPSSCQSGKGGSGAGQLKEAFGVAVDATGAIYVFEVVNLRLQKFSSPGVFELMIGGEVNKTTSADLCTSASSDVCGAGIEGVGPREFSAGFGGTTVAVGSGGSILVGDKGRIQEFDSSGAFKSEVPLSTGDLVTSLAVDPVSGDIYVVRKGEEDVLRVDESGAERDSLPVQIPGALATDPSGNVYVVDVARQEHPERILEFDAGGSLVSEFDQEIKEDIESEEIEIVGLGTNTVGDLYAAHALAATRAFLTAYGPPPLAYGPPPAAPPTVDAQFLLSSDSTKGVVRAKINPHFWADTTYFVEFGLVDCDFNPCARQPLSSDLELGAGAVDRSATTASVTLDGLKPSTTYHYRFVAVSGGGGPSVGTDATFTTPPPVDPPETNCPNQAFRTGPSADLPDCRSYEMVSPVDKSGGDILAVGNINGFETRLNQSTPDGNALTYSSYRAFADPKAAPFTSQYLARRGSGGWSSDSLSPARGGPSYYGTGDTGENTFKAFSEDLCNAWVVPDAPPVLAAGAIEGFPNLYRRDNCPAPGSYEALSTAAPPNVPAVKYYPELQGTSADGSRTVFRVNDNLIAGMPAQPASCASKLEDCLARVYEANGGTLSNVCILPDGSPYAGDCSAGSPSPGVSAYLNRTASVSNAVSEDGSRVYWSAGSGPTGPGKIYVRVNATTTVKVSETQSTLKSFYWGAATDGSKALFTVTEGAKAENLYLYSLSGTSGSSALVAGEVLGVAGASDDLSRVYFVSKAVLAGTTGASAGKANLYLHEASGNTFIATLSSKDVLTPAQGSPVPSNIAPQSVFHVARATPDGEQLAFISTNPLTGFDNTDAESGEADSEVFRYDAAAKELDCVSCSPVGAAPVGRNLQTPGNGGRLWTAATIPAGANQLYTPRALSDDGTRLFFTSYVPLVGRDENEKADVYEWEAPGTGSCTEAKAAYSSVTGGCLYLISTGSSDEDSELVDSSPSGQDVFFATEESLLVQDPGLIDIYDARAGGGFPAPQVKVPCDPEAGACQSPPSEPGYVPPVSTAPTEGNPPIKKPKCPKGKHRVTKNGKSKCVKNKNKKKNKGGKSKRGSSTSQSGRAAR